MIIQGKEFPCKSNGNANRRAQNMLPAVHPSCYSPGSHVARLLPAKPCLQNQQSVMMLLPENPLISLWDLGHYPVVRADGNELSKWHLPLLLNCKHGIFLFMYFSSHGGIFLKTQRRLDPSVHFPMIEFPPLLREKINK